MSVRTYAPLIRLARFRIDDISARLAALDQVREHLAAQVDQLTESVPESQVAPDAAKEGFVAYGSYAQAVIVRKQNLAASIADVDAEARTLRGALDDARAQLARHEGLEARRITAMGRQRPRRVVA